MNNIRDGRWIRCSKRNPCPICGKYDWCCWLSTKDVFYCMRVNVDVPGFRTGSTSPLNGTSFFPTSEFPPVLDPITDTRNITKSTTVIPWDVIVDETKLKLTSKLSDLLCKSIGTNKKTIESMDVGWSVHYKAFTFPMLNIEDYKICGVRTRTLDGAKFAFTGSKQGYFIPKCYPNKNGVEFVCEGVTDAMALHSIGVKSIGRASCGHWSNGLLKYLDKKKTIIIGDNDEVGKSGAISLAKRIGDNATIIYPPPQYKDVRQWIQSESVSIDTLMNTNALE